MNGVITVGWSPCACPPTCLQAQLIFPFSLAFPAFAFRWLGGRAGSVKHRFGRVVAISADADVLRRRLAVKRESELDSGRGRVHGEVQAVNALISFEVECDCGSS